MNEGTLIMSGLKFDTIKTAIDIVVGQCSDENMKIVTDYDTENVSKKIVRCIVSYTDYINKTVWNKY